MSLTAPRGHAPRYRLLFVLAGACLALPATAQHDRAAVLHTNRLIDSNNPYLLQHAHNPVDWYPWGAEAFHRAKRDNKPIFLSIGYSTCYWCHVAERTLFSNPEIAGMMNEWFVSIKVDREERPDVDAVYLLATQLITGGAGGWPNNVFLTPDLEPFYAGGYFPPADDDSGRPGFPSVLAALHDEWVQNPERVRQRAQGVVEALRRMQASSTASPQRALEPRAWLSSARASVLKRFDTEHGGLAGARQSTKFPQSPALGLMLTDYRLGGDPETLRFLSVTLDAMADGGLYDQLGGGFHRYSTERTWSIPHFEKMLYDNAQLLSVYLEAWKLTGRPQYKRIARGVRDYLRRQMIAPQGGFYTAEDAAMEGVEGATYLWTRPEIEAALGSETERFLQVYALTPMPDPEDPLHPESAPGVLRVRTSGGDHRDALEAKLADLDTQRRELLRVRNARPQPQRDEKLLVGLNGLAIEAFAASGAALHSKADLADASQAARRLWKLAWRGEAGGLAHAVFRDRAQGEGFLDDYALLGIGFLGLYESTGDKTWLRRARTLADALLQRFDPDRDGTLASAAGAQRLIFAPPEQGDEAYPSGTSAALTLLARLGKATGDKRYTEAAARIARQLRGQPERSPTLVAAVNVNVLDDGARAAPRDGTGRPGDQTAAHVRVSGTIRARATYDEIVVKLDIEQGFHINANPASFDFLIPTTVTFSDVQPFEVRYASPRSFRPSFAPDALNVYEGQVQVVARVKKDALAKVQTLKAAITAQACTATVCLPPSQMPLTVRVRRAR